VGASVTGLVGLLSSDFLKLTLIAILIAFPLSWWAMHAWLQSFAYRVKIGPAIFGIAALVTLVITVLTISYQSIKAARANPVKSLRSE
jgi:putative ABC transport system permease protein